MKKLVYAISIFLMLASCKKEEAIEPDYFSEPVTSWSLNKAEVKAKERRVLKADHGPDDVIYLSDIFESKGSGYLEYKGDIEQLKQVSYDFFCNNLTLIQSYCEFVNNEKIETDLTNFLIRKYGQIYDETIDGNDKTLTWTRDGKIIKLFATDTGLSVLYRKNPL